jgi:hypothetical protein
MNPEFSTKWSTGDEIKDNGDIGQLSIQGNTITFHINGYGDILARNFVGHDSMHNYKVYTYGQSNADENGHFYQVSKVFLYNGDYKEFTGDYIRGIKSFSFEIPGLSNWLNIMSVDFGFLEDKSIIIHEVPTPTIVLKQANPYIYIEFEKKDALDIFDDKNQKTIKKIPRLYVVFTDLVDDRKVVETITILMRFFSLLIGKVSIAEDVRLDLDGKDKKMWLFLNRDFSVHYSCNAYWMRHRYKFEDVHDSLLQWFEKWYSFSCDESYEILLEAYFQICSKKASSIEDVFLTYCRFMEGYDLRKSRDEEIAQELECDILPALSEDNFKNAISPFFVKAASKYKPKDAAQWISAGFLGRIGLDSRIKRLDEANFSFIVANRDRICRGIDANKIYGKISKTRNYYAHYKADQSGILEIGEMYNALSYMEMLILSVLMSEMGIDTETRKNAFIHDEAFWMNATHLRPDDMS